MPTTGAALAFSTKSLRHAGRCGRMKVVLEVLRIEEIASVQGIELTEREEDLAGGSMATLSDRLKGRSDLNFHHPFVVTAEGRAVGFLMLREQSALPSWATTGAISLHNFRISRHAQGRGFGTAALALAAIWTAVHRPASTTLVLSVNEENESAIRLYGRCGFKCSGLPILGRLGTEIILSCDVSELLQNYIADG